MNRLVFIGILVSGLVFINFYLVPDGGDKVANKYEGRPFVGNYFPSLQDTVYTLEDAYVHVNLETQTARVVHRDGTVKDFDISSGTPHIIDGMETNKGLFYIYAKFEQWYSRQFDSTLMTHFMPFNYGIGFHGLWNNRYYQYLGNKPSSHGCVRVSREDVKEVFELVDVGSPVLVDEGNSAIVIAFADSADKLEKLDVEKMLEEMPARLEAMYDGLYFASRPKKLLVSKENIPPQGLPIGDRKKIPARQDLSYLNQDYFIVGSDILEPEKESWRKVKFTADHEDDRAMLQRAIQ